MTAIVTIVPSWIIAVFLFGLLWFGSRLGSALRLRLNINSETTYATSAAVSLLALLIGFTFSMSLNRYDGRSQLVIEEAAAISALWQRLPMVPQPQQGKMATLTRHYADQRLAYFTFGIDKDRALRADQSADDITQRIWVILHKMSAINEAPLTARTLMDNLTRIEDAAWRRDAMGREHVPSLIIDLLVVFTFLTAISMGFAAPRDKRVHPTHLIFFALTGSAIMLMLDLDHPRSGLVRVSQRPMEEVIAIMAAHAGDAERVNPRPATAAAPELPPAAQSPDASTPRR